MKKKGMDDEMKKSTILQIIGVVLFLSIIVILLKITDKGTADTKNGNNIGYQGMYLDYVNGSPLENQGEISRKYINDSENVILLGWAADVTVNKPLSSLSVKIGDTVVECTYGIERTSVSDYFGNSELIMTGFEVTIPKQALENAKKIEFIQVSNDGKTTFESVIYKLID